MRLFLRHRSLVAVTEAVTADGIGATHFELRTRFSIDSTDLDIDQILSEFRRDAEVVFLTWWKGRGLHIEEINRRDEASVSMNVVGWESLTPKGEQDATP